MAMFKNDPRDLIGYECTLDSMIAEIGNFPEFKEECEALRKAQGMFQDKAKSLYPDLKWQFGQ